MRQSHARRLAKAVQEEAMESDAVAGQESSQELNCKVKLIVSICQRTWNFQAASLVVDRDDGRTKQDTHIPDMATRGT